MKIGYARVSTVAQELDTQKEILKNHDCEKIYIEKVTGTSTAPRKQLKAMMENIRPGDEIVVVKIDRLARSIIDLNNLVQEITNKGASIIFIKDNMEFKPGENNGMQTLMFNILGSFAQFERDMIVERTTEGRNRAKAQGKHMGRPSRPKKDIKRALEMYHSKDDNGYSVSDIIKLTGVPKATLYNELKKESVK